MLPTGLRCGGGGHSLTGHRSERASPHNTPFPGSAPSPNPLTYIHSSFYPAESRPRPGVGLVLTLDGGASCRPASSPCPQTPRDGRVTCGAPPSSAKGQGREATRERKVQVKTGSKCQVGAGGIPTCSRCAPLLPPPKRVRKVRGATRERSRTKTKTKNGSTSRPPSAKLGDPSQRVPGAPHLPPQSDTGKRRGALRKGAKGQGREATWEKKGPGKKRVQVPSWGGAPQCVPGAHFGQRRGLGEQVAPAVAPNLAQTGPALLLGSGCGSGLRAINQSISSSARLGLRGPRLGERRERRGRGRGREAARGGGGEGDQSRWPPTRDGPHWRAAAASPGPQLPRTGSPQVGRNRGPSPYVRLLQSPQRELGRAAPTGAAPARSACLQVAPDCRSLVPGSEGFLTRRTW